MRKYFYSVLVMVFAGVLLYSYSEANAKKYANKITSKSFYDFSIKTLDGKNQINLKDFKGKYVMCVNVASKCGYTPQYADLQKLADTYKDKLVIIGFPCNQFMGQEPGSADEIASFCQKNYGVKFLLTEKIDVKGSNANAIYQWLTNKSLNGVSDATIKWNFNKILIDPNGKWLSYFSSGTAPLSNEITALIK
jgi:glutathione peroxidase